jgi:hypothetical protein
VTVSKSHYYIATGELREELFVSWVRDRSADELQANWEKGDCSVLSCGLSEICDSCHASDFC